MGFFLHKLLHIDFYFVPAHLPGFPMPLQRHWHMYSVRVLLLNSIFFFFLQNVGLILPPFPVLSFISIPIYENSLVENSLA